MKSFAISTPTSFNWPHSLIPAQMMMTFLSFIVFILLEVIQQVLNFQKTPFRRSCWRWNHCQWRSVRKEKEKREEEIKKNFSKKLVKFEIGTSAFKKNTPKTYFIPNSQQKEQRKVENSKCQMRNDELNRFESKLEFSGCAHNRMKSVSAPDKWRFKVKLKQKQCKRNKISCFELKKWKTRATLDSRNSFNTKKRKKK